MWNDKKSGSLKQNNLIRPTDGSKLVQLRLEDLHIRNQRVHDVGPRPIQRLVPDWRRETLHVESE